MKNETLEEYLSIKFQRPIKKLTLNNSIPKIYLGKDNTIFEYDSKRILKIEKLLYNYKRDEFIGLYNYLKEHSNVLPIAKIYDVGEIKLPRNLTGRYTYRNDNFYYYTLMEKVKIDDNLSKSLIFLDKNGKKIVNNFYDDKVMGSSTFFYELFNSNTNEEILETFKEDDDFNLYYDIIKELIDMSLIFKKHNISWIDVHPGQFGYNNKGDIVAFDIDGLKIIERKYLNMKTIIKENKYIKTFESFDKISMVQNEIIDLIQNDKNIFVKFIEDYPEHDKNKSYTPVDVDNDGTITLDIDGGLFYTKSEWVEGIDETITYYDVEPEMTQPEKGENSAEVSWKDDKEFIELVRNHGGRKGVIKRMKRKFNIDYSDSKTYQDLYVNLKADGM